MNEQLTDLLNAIHEALYLPPADTDEAEQLRLRLFEERARDVRVTAASLTEAEPVDAAEVANAARQLREWTAQTPANYPRWTPALPEVAS
jgi:HEPN domain-containing protein